MQLHLSDNDNLIGDLMTGWVGMNIPVRPNPPRLGVVDQQMTCQSQSNRPVQSPLTQPRWLLCVPAPSTLACIEDAGTGDSPGVTLCAGVWVLVGRYLDAGSSKPHRDALTEERRRDRTRTN